MNVTNLILHLKAMITDNTLDQAMVSKAIKLLELGAVYQADTFASLPTPSTANAGQLYYVLYDGLYWSTGEYWIPIVQTDVSRMWGWGANGNTCRLSDGTNINRSSPVSVVVGFTDWCQVSAGLGAGFGLRRNGTLWAWGGYSTGETGTNSEGTRASPTLVVGGFTDWCQVSAGRVHALGLRCNSTAWAWGSNGQGRLGDNSALQRNSPVSVVGGFTDWRQVSAGNYHSLGVRTNGTAWAWGSNSNGRLGDDTTISRSSPVSVVGGFTDWCQVSAGNYHSLGVRNNGTAWAWGGNNTGQLGDGTAISRSSPVSVVGGFTDWCQVSAGYAHNLGIRTNGTAWAWGCNNAGQLGDGTAISRSSPVSVVGGFTDWCQVSAGRAHALGVRTNGTAWAWGCNNAGRLGDNTAIDRSSPVSVVGGFSNWSVVGTGPVSAFSLAVRKTTT
jgi:alpha-tubulin suppressor-like RCC1 family protein